MGVTGVPSEEEPEALEVEVTVLDIGVVLEQPARANAIAAAAAEMSNLRVIVDHPRGSFWCDFAVFRQKGMRGERCDSQRSHES
jgi:hypothetical protein